jgi:hypothetical protein
MGMEELGWLEEAQSQDTSEFFVIFKSLDLEFPVSHPYLTLPMISL